MASLIIICGLPGVGKTTVAKKLAAKTKAILLRTDVIRKESKKVDYSEKVMRGVYEKMFFQAKNLLKEGKDVILDATFYARKRRGVAKKIAKEVGAGFKIVEVICPKNLVKKRMKKRKRDESEAEFKHYLIFTKLFEPVKEKHLIIDTSKNIEKQLTKWF